MMRVYELWEGVSGNLMAAFDSEAEALAAVSRRATRYGPQSIDALSLVASDDDGEDIIEIASGSDLFRRACPPQPSVRPAAADVPRRGLRVGEAHSS
jgi:hypothetical protein